MELQSLRPAFELVLLEPVEGEIDLRMRAPYKHPAVGGVHRWRSWNLDCGAVWLVLQGRGRAQDATPSKTAGEHCFPLQLVECVPNLDSVQLQALSKAVLEWLAARLGLQFPQKLP